MVQKSSAIILTALVLGMTSVPAMGSKLKSRIQKAEHSAESGLHKAEKVTMNGIKNYGPTALEIGSAFLRRNDLYDDVDLLAREIPETLLFLVRREPSKVKAVRPKQRMNPMGSSRHGTGLSRQSSTHGTGLSRQSSTHESGSKSRGMGLVKSGVTAASFGASFGAANANANAANAANANTDTGTGTGTEMTQQSREYEDEEEIFGREPSKKPHRSGSPRKRMGVSSKKTSENLVNTASNLNANTDTNAGTGTGMTTERREYEDEEEIFGREPSKKPHRSGSPRKRMGVGSKKTSENLVNTASNLNANTDTNAGTRTEMTTERREYEDEEEIFGRNFGYDLEELD